MVCMKESFGERLRYLREEKGVGQVQMAKDIDVGKSVISARELDKCEPTLGNLVRLAEYFGVSLDWLAGLVS